jgi:hypothetical protein
MAERSIDKREQYVAFATHCLQLAKVAADRQSRVVLKEMAAEWLRLAEVDEMRLSGLLGSSTSVGRIEQGVSP